MFKKIDGEFISNVNMILATFGVAQSVEQVEDDAHSLTLFGDYTLTRLNDGDNAPGWNVTKNVLGPLGDQQKALRKKAGLEPIKDQEVYLGKCLKTALQETIKDYMADQTAQKLETLFSNPSLAKWFDTQG